MKRKAFCRQKINIQLRHNYQKTVKDIAATLQKAQKQAIRIPHGNVFTQKRAKERPRTTGAMSSETRNNLACTDVLT